MNYLLVVVAYQKLRYLNIVLITIFGITNIGQEYGRILIIMRNCVHVFLMLIDVKIVLWKSIFIRAFADLHIGLLNTDI